MQDLLWFSGITWNTPIRDIGWSYVAALALGALITRLAREILKHSEGPPDRNGPSHPSQ